MVRTAAVRPMGREARWASGSWYLLAIAVSHIPLGLAGLFLDRSFPIGAEAARDAGSRYVFGVLETNGWHSLAALLLGVLAAGVLIAAPQRARLVALYIGLTNLGLALSLIASDPTTFWLASNGADQIIHFSTALGGIVTALLKPAVNG